MRHPTDGGLFVRLSVEGSAAREPKILRGTRIRPFKGAEWLHASEERCLCNDLPNVLMPRFPPPELNMVK